MADNTILIDDDIKLADLLGVEELQLAQDATANMGRMACLITDENGIALTNGSNFSRFCTDFCRKSEEGRKRCEACDMMGALSARDQGKPVYYYCHAGLIDFSAPILLGDKIIGSFVGGQVLSKEPEILKIKKIAREIGVDEDEFVEAAKEVPILPEHAIKRCTEFVYNQAQILSSLAYKAYEAKKEGLEALKAATAKTDFLANMSHEIRTPMNAIIGMSQIALREEMSSKARDYISQVSHSADMLLTIINDILDYSKLEAGKMSIVETTYSPAMIIKDVGSIVQSRVAGKNIEFIIDIDPSMPRELKGDDIRIKQILVNLANNAVKFTEEGQVYLSLKYTKVDNETIKLKGIVKDTGIGIKKEDIKALFNSFEQVDSKRNRKVEGTGLGLAIVKELVENMGGEVFVESEYGQGSTFFFEIPQKIVNPKRIVELLEECPSVVGVINSPYLKNQIRKDMNTLGVQYLEATIDTAEEVMSKLHVDFVITEDEITPKRFADFTKAHLNTRFFIFCSDNPKDYSELDNVKLIRRPASLIKIASLMLNKRFDVKNDESVESELDFSAPDAKILIVDDNEVNLSVAEGLLEPLNMQIDTADSGIKALELVADKRYDIIFMDHMMPEMDGVETTIAIREKYPEYKDIPIVALTANALASSREELLSSGMNDFVAKPIVLTAILGVIKKWLKPELIKGLGEGADTSVADKTPKADESILEQLTFLDTHYALDLLKTEKLYMKVLSDYYNMIDKKHDKIKECLEGNDIALYTVEVHALKSSSKQIGAMELSDDAKALEAAGNARDIDTIMQMTGKMLDEYLELKEKLAPFFEVKEDSAKPSAFVSMEDIKAKALEIESALDELDLDKAEETVKELLNNDMDPKIKEMLTDLCQKVTDMDIDGCIEVLGSIAAI